MKPTSTDAPSVLRMRINGRWIEDETIRPTQTLLRYLRDQLHMTGTKEGCAEGDCGACTVAVLDPDAPKGPTYRAINSCLVLLPMVQGKEIVTVEGLAENGQLHPVQESLVEALGSQCGYCTPGVVMSMFEAHYRDDLDEAWKLDDQMCGNLCRCTGYRPIMDATKAIAGVCPNDRFQQAAQAAQTPTMHLHYTHKAHEQHYYNPTTLDEVWALIKAHPEARFVCGGTDLSLEITKRFEHPQTLISLEALPSLSQITSGEDGLTIGAAVLLSELEAAAKVPFPAIERMLRFFGARQIKNRGTIGGNLCTASPIGDLPPVLLSLDAHVNLRSQSGLRTIPLADFFLDYRQTALAPGEILESVFVPWLPEDADLRSCAYKVSKRQELDISAVSAGFFVRLEGGQVTEARLAYGGMAATPKRATHVEQALIGQPWTEDAVTAASDLLAQDFAPIDDHRGSAWYRRTVARNLLIGFFLETEQTHQPRLPYRPTGTVALHTEEAP